MDVLHVLHQFPPETRGGSESYVREVALAQRRRGLDAQVLSGSLEARPQLCIDEEEVDGIPVYRLHRSDYFFDHHVKAWHPGVAAAIGALLDRLRPSLVHVHHWVRLTCDLVEIASERGIPVVVTLHDYYTSCPRAFRVRKGDPACLRPVSGESCADCVPKYGHEPRDELEEGVDLFADGYRRELSLARRVFVSIGSVGRLLAEVTGMPEQRYEVLPLGYEPRFKGQPPLPPPAPGETFRFAFWGGVGRHKGVHVLVAAFGQLAARHPGVELHVLGGFESPDYERELRGLAEGLPVTFHGPFTSEDLRRVAPHCGTFPSTCLETYGIVLDECFELGLPCIVSDRGALPERVGDAGIAAAAGDVQSLADVMLRMVTEPDLLQRLRQAVPPLPTGLEAHVDTMLGHYEAARNSGPSLAPAPAIPLMRRLQFLQYQRDTAWTHLTPPGGPQ